MNSSKRRAGSSQSHLNASSFITPLEFKGYQGASYIHNFTIGDVEVDCENQSVFAVKSVNIRSEQYYPLVKCTIKGFKSFETEDQKCWEYDLNKNTHGKSLRKIVSLYSKYENDFLFQLRLRWRHKIDNNFQKKVLSGERTPLPENADEWMFTTRGITFYHEDLETFLFLKLKSLIINSLPDQEFKEHLNNFLHFIQNHSQESLKNICQKDDEIYFENYDEKLRFLSTEFIRYCTHHSLDYKDPYFSNIMNSLQSNISTVFSLLELINISYSRDLNG